MSQELLFQEEESPYPPVTVCPKCGGPMEEIPVEEMSLDRCQACGGLWLDAGELEKILALDYKALMEEKHRARTPAEMDAKKVECPSCGGLLIKMHHLQHPEVTLDGCVVCYGTWLDGGELTELQSPSWLNKARHLLQGILGRE